MFEVKIIVFLHDVQRCSFWNVAVFTVTPKDLSFCSRERVEGHFV
jgi:hypothetical protein